jgi:hypothetical protein
MLNLTNINETYGLSGCMEVVTYDTYIKVEKTEVFRLSWLKFN